jgi:K+/H+ antiporter YhaU regulatory subunit KhtT
MTDVHVQARRLPGVGWRYTIPADGGRQVVVVVEDRGPRHLALLDPRLDEALTTVRLPAERASALAALLTGARFTLNSLDEPAGEGGADPREAVVETLPIDGVRRRPA